TEALVEAASEPVPSLEYQAPADVPSSVQEEQPLSAAPEVGNAKVPEELEGSRSQASDTATTTDLEHAAVAASVELEVPAAAAAAAAATGGDHESIAQAVHRVM